MAFVRKRLISCSHASGWSCGRIIVSGGLVVLALDDFGDWFEVNESGYMLQRKTFGKLAGAILS